VSGSSNPLIVGPVGRARVPIEVIVAIELLSPDPLVMGRGSMMNLNNVEMYI
jgi:hypothetical protein